MDNESRASVDTTISHSSHATDVYPPPNHYDVPRDVVSGGRAGDYEMWQLSDSSPRDIRKPRYENWELTNTKTTNNNNNLKQTRVTCAFKVLAAILLLTTLLVIAVAEVVKTVQCPRPT